MNEQTQLSEAIILSANAHRGQFDKDGYPYILHPLRLMEKLIFDLELATIAILSSSIKYSLSIGVLEDYKFSERIITAVDLLTYREDEDYIEEYIKGICFNYDAIRVKFKDIEEDDSKRGEKYHRAFVMLGEAKEKFTRGCEAPCSLLSVARNEL